jgi:O-antigen ligase
VSDSVAWHARARLERDGAGLRLAAFALGSVPIVLLGYHDGGYGERTWTFAGVALGSGAALQLVLGAPRPQRLALVALAALSGLGVLMATSGIWGIDGAEPAHEAQRCVLYVAALAAFVLLARPGAAAALLTGVLTGIVGLAAMALTDRAVSPPPLDPYQGALLFEPVGYANALGILMALGVVLAIGLLLDVRGWTARAGLAAAAGVTLVALSLTASRAAFMATAAGLGALALLRARASRGVVVGVVVVVCLALAAGGSRADLGDRSSYWSVAIAEAAERPLLGSGAGSFDDSWREHRPIPASVHDAHSVYLETAAELGAVGLVFLLCALAAPLLTLARRRTTSAPAAGAAYIAFLLHAGVDWDWEMPVTVVAGLACGAALLVGDGAS